MIRELRYFNDPILKQKCEEVTEFDEELKQLVQDMTDTMVRYKGVGLAAPQIGVAKRVIIYTDNFDKIQSIVNPVIVDTYPLYERAKEGCLSYPNISRLVNRPRSIIVYGYDVSGCFMTIRAEEMAARIICHEIDHLNGVCKVGARL